MLSVKTNEEYKALQKEIEHAQAAIKKVEDEILNLMMEAEAATERNQAGRSPAERRPASASAPSAKPSKWRIRRTCPRLRPTSRSGRKSKSAVSEICLPRYERVRKYRGGIGVAAARDYVCEVCEVRIRPQVFQEDTKNDQIIAVRAPASEFSIIRKTSTIHLKLHEPA